MQKFYLHDANAVPEYGSLPGAASLNSGAPDVTAAAASTNRAMDAAIGVAQASSALATLARTTGQSGWFRRFISPPLAAQTIPGGNWVVALAGSQSNTGSGLILAVGQWIWRPSTGAVVYNFYSGFITQVGTATGTAETAETASLFDGGATVQDHDRLVLEVWRAFASQSTATSYANTLFYDGTVEGSISSNAAYLQAPTDLRVLQGGATSVFSQDAYAVLAAHQDAYPVAAFCTDV